MATERYWNDLLRQLLSPVSGDLARLPMSEAALVHNGPTLAVQSALLFLVLGRAEEASRILEFLPRLEAALGDPSRFASMPEYRRRENAAHLRVALLLGHWLRDGVLQARLAADAYDHLLALNQWWGGKYTGLNLHGLMLLLVEAGSPDAALQLYLDHEPRPVALPPRDLRFSANPRAVLFASLSKTPALPKHTLESALSLLQKRATRWELRSRPIPHLGVVALARTLRACRAALGLDASLPEILVLLR